MPDNQGLSHLSDHFLIVAVVLYSLAVIAFAADFAFGRRSPVVSRAGAGVRHRVPAAVGAGGPALDGEGADTAALDSAEVDSTALAGGGVAGGGVASGAVAGRPGAGQAGNGGAAGSGAVASGQRGRTDVPPGRLVRIALVLTTAGVALHLTGVVTRGVAVHRVPWGDMYEFVISVSCVAVLVFLG